MITLLLSLLLILPAQSVAYHPFIRAERNVLEKPAGASPTFDIFLRKLDTLVSTGGADVRILHVGGSHVQSGIWSDRLRRRFLSLRYGCDGGRGLVFPFAAAGTNTPVSYTSYVFGNWEAASCLKPGNCTLGLCGMSLTARDTSARIMIDLLPQQLRALQHRYAFRRVEVLGEGSLEPVLLLSKKDTLRGDNGHFRLPYYTDWVHLAFEGRGSYTLRGLYLDKDCSGLTFSEAGVNGASTTAWLRCERWEEDLRRVKPDLVIFSIGINDIQGADFDAQRFKANYRELMKAVRRVNPRCAILLSGINDSVRRGSPNAHTQRAQEAFRELARECAGVFWDFYGIMGGEGSISRWQEAGLAKSDLVHLTPGGYKLVGDLVFDAIMEEYRKHD